MIKNFLFLLVFILIINPLLSEKLMLISNTPYVLDEGNWKDYFNNRNWKDYELIEADRNSFYIYLNSYKIPKSMDWRKPSWGLWDIRNNTFSPIKKIPSNLVPIRRVGSLIFLANKRQTAFYYLDLDSLRITKIQSSIKIRGWFPRADGSIAYILEDENCENFKGSKQGKMWSVCLMSSDFQEVESVISIEPGIDPMLSGDSDNYIVLWHKNLSEKLWILDAINLESGAVKVITKSNHEEISQQNPPFWLSWIRNNWVVYERFVPINQEKEEESNSNTEKTNPPSMQKSFIAYNISSEKRKEILLDEKAEMIAEPGNSSGRSMSYSPYLIIINYSNQENGVKVIDVEELKVVLETKFPLEELKTKRPSFGIFHP